MTLPVSVEFKEIYNTNSTDTGRWTLVGDKHDEGYVEKVVMVKNFP